MTAYRQQALAVANALAGTPSRPRDLRILAPDAAKILRGNVYGWFERIERGLYGLTSSGRVALVTWADKFQPGDKRGFEAQRGPARRGSDGIPPRYEPREAAYPAIDYSCAFSAEATGFSFERKHWCRRVAQSKGARDPTAPSVSTDPGLVLVRGPDHPDL
jgi:hypothetical protein